MTYVGDVGKKLGLGCSEITNKRLKYMFPSI